MADPPPVPPVPPVPPPVPPTQARVPPIPPVARPVEVPPIENRENLGNAELMQIYHHIKFGRLFEERIYALYKQGRLPGAIYLARGQEAMEVGCAFALEPSDIVAGTHRDEILALTKGMPLGALLLNYYGKAAGPTRGRDGNSHMSDFSHGVLNVVSHLPDGYPPAMGCALAFKLRNEPRVALAICGEGATNNGTWHETMNFAAVMNLPFLAVVQNNQYAYSSTNEVEFRCENIADRARGYGIPGVAIDGNDILAVIAAVRDAAERARSGDGPTLIVGETFRVYGHAGHDSADYVPDEVREYWDARDPLRRFEAFLETKGILTPELRDETEARIKREILDEVEIAMAAPDPDPDEVADGVFG